jgi:hypothetical protein
MPLPVAEPLQLFQCLCGATKLCFKVKWPLSRVRKGYNTSVAIALQRTCTSTKQDSTHTVSLSTNARAHAHTLFIPTSRLKQVKSVGLKSFKAPLLLLWPQKSSCKLLRGILNGTRHNIHLRTGDTTLGRLWQYTHLLLYEAESNQNWIWNCCPAARLHYQII